MHTAPPPGAPPPAPPGGATAPVGAKHHLKTIYAPTQQDQLRPGESVEGLVQHEIKDLGMHSLVCTVTYAAKIDGEGGTATTLSRSFRKVRPSVHVRVGTENWADCDAVQVYKFQVGIDSTTIDTNRMLTCECRRCRTRCP